MKKRGSVNVKLGCIIIVSLAIVFIILNTFSVKVLENEVLAQWEVEDSRIAELYSKLLVERQCSSAEEYQAFIDEISAAEEFNYVVYIEDVEGEVTAIAHSNHDRIGLVLEDEGSIAAAREGQPYIGYYTDPVTGKKTLDVLNPIYNDEGKLQGALNIGALVDSETMSSMVKTSIISLTAISVVFAIILIIVIALILKMIVIRPLAVLSKEIDKMSNYDLTVQKDNILEKYQKRNDEIGAISQGFVVMRESLVHMIQNISQVSSELTAHSENLSIVSSDVKESGEQLAQTVDQVANGAMVQAQQTTEGSSKMVELSKLVEKVEYNMSSLNQATREVEAIKQQGVQVLDELVDKTEQNNENSKQVFKVMNETSQQAEKIKTASVQIQNIASQTNLLALNAAIESARAGEAGKGFAVVATEIGNLSKQTNELTSGIDDIIKELVVKIDEAVSTMEKMGATSLQQEESVSDTKAKFEEIMKNMQIMEEKCTILGQSTSEMRTNEKVIVDVINDLSSLSEENAACMQEAAASVATQEQSIEKVSDSSEDVARLARSLQEEIKKFKL